MLNAVHFLLTYQCNFECDHCFLYCGPFSEGVFTVEHMEMALKQAREIKSIEWVYFEGGEPFLYYPLLINSIKLAKKLKFKAGIVTNSYWATTEADAGLWLEPI
jgi:MoaA/NifB/PqqE/SkfB family radical SAM enzyme